MYCTFNTFWPCILHKSITNSFFKTQMSKQLIHGRALSKTRYSLTSPCGHLYNMDTSLLQTVRLVQKSQKSHIPYLYNKDTSVKWTLGSVPLVSVLKRFDCTKQEKENNMSDHSLMLCLYGKTLSQVHVEGSLTYPSYRH